jgi:hypothetical protein
MTATLGASGRHRAPRRQPDGPDPRFRDAGDLDRARRFHEQLEAIASFPSLRSLGAYVAGEIDNFAGRPDDALAHYARAIDLAHVSGSAFISGIAAAGVPTAPAAP